MQQIGQSFGALQARTTNAALSFGNLLGPLNMTIIGLGSLAFAVYRISSTFDFLNTTSEEWAARMQGQTQQFGEVKQVIQTFIAQKKAGQPLGITAEQYLRFGELKLLTLVGEAAKRIELGEVQTASDALKTIFDPYIEAQKGVLTEEALRGAKATTDALLSLTKAQEQLATAGAHGTTVTGVYQPIEGGDTVAMLRQRHQELMAGNKFPNYTRHRDEVARFMAEGNLLGLPFEGGLPLGPIGRLFGGVTAGLIDLSTFLPRWIAEGFYPKESPERIAELLGPGGMSSAKVEITLKEGHQLVGGATLDLQTQQVKNIMRERGIAVDHVDWYLAPRR